MSAPSPSSGPQPPLPPSLTDRYTQDRSAPGVGPPTSAGGATQGVAAHSQQQQLNHNQDQHRGDDGKRTGVAPYQGQQQKQAGFLGGPKPPRRLDGPPRAAPNSLTPAQPAPPTTTTPTTVFPALHLTPLNGTFVPKQISLDPPGTRVKIGRQTNAKTIPNGTNGYFDSKVLSRAHAEVWSEDNKVFIKDVKSSNGTFINGERLSPESSESDVFELHTDDVVEFGIDILTDDTKTIVHHKVAAKVHLVLNADDALASSREINNWYRSASAEQQQHAQSNPALHSLNRGIGGGASGMGGGGMGRAGPGGRPGMGGQGGHGVSFEHVLSRLQGELQKSRDTGANLTDVNSTLTQVHDTLGGGAPPPIPPGAGIPGRSTSAFPPRNGAANAEHAQSIANLQAQLADTQSSLAGHVGKIRDLEGLLAEHDVIKREVGALRSQMELAQEGWAAMMREQQEQRELEGKKDRKGRESGVNGGRESPIAALLEAEEDDELAEDDDDDAASVASVDTIVAGPKTNGVKDKSVEDAADDEEKTTDAPSSPPPASTPALPSITKTPSDAEDARSRLLAEQNAALSARLEALSAELEEASKLGETLRSQHASASETIKALETRIRDLEKAVEGRVKEAERGAEEKWVGWRERFEASWREERGAWEEEREGLRRAVREWEEGKERDRREREERRRRREERRRARNAAAQEEDDESSGEEEDDEDGFSSSDDDEDEEATPASSPSKRSSPRKARRSPSPSSSAAARAGSSSTSSTLKASSAPSGLPASISPSSAEALAAGLANASSAASDSDSTIGERSAAGAGFVPRGSKLRGGVAGGGVGGIGGQDSRLTSPACHLLAQNAPPQQPQQPHGLPFSLAGAVVVIAVAVGYGAALKLKE
ncbi:hypothetical protein JCM8097_002832 [Rhodosporidiobolus ruineniae]